MEIKEKDFYDITSTWVIIRSVILLLVLISMIIFPQLKLELLFYVGFAIGFFYGEGVGISETRSKTLRNAMNRKIKERKANGE